MSLEDDTKPDITPDPGPLRIDLPKVLSDKLGRRARFVPRFIVRRLEKIICVEQLNELLRKNYPLTGADFCKGVFRDLNVNIRATHSENLPTASNRRVVIVSNHPLGGLDGMALIDFFTSYYGGRVHFIVNDVLMAIKPLNDVFVPVNKYGAQNRESAHIIDELFAGDDPILIFPAGLCSRLSDDGSIRDLEWKKMFVNRAIASHRDIIPVFFSGENSNFFYKFAHRRKKLGIKFNIELIYLPRELFRSAGKTFTIVCGKSIPYTSIKGGRHAADSANDIKNSVYELSRLLSE